jgi:UDP:flavonoid glycosyltransferase YjiC (YdhE family)
VYIGFGSLLVDNPKGLTEMILSAARRTNQRIILCR